MPAATTLEVEGESMSDETAKDRSLKQEEPLTDGFRGALRIMQQGQKVLLACMRGTFSKIEAKGMFVVGVSM